MIANNSVRSAICFLHLGIAIFCLGIFALIITSEMKVSLTAFLHNKEFFSFLLIAIIGSISFVIFLTLQANSTKTAIYLSYFVSLLFIIEYITISQHISSRVETLIGFMIPTFVPSLLVFLLAFSKISKSKHANTSSLNNLLDSDFLIGQNDEKYKTKIFWKPNRIVSVSSFLFSILLFLVLLITNSPTWIIFIPCLFFVGSAILWLFPKIGSWIFSVVSILTGIILFFGIEILLFQRYQDSTIAMDTKEFISIVILFSTSTIGLSIIFVSLSMLLLSKEAKDRWVTSEIV